MEEGFWGSKDFYSKALGQKLVLGTWRDVEPGRSRARMKQHVVTRFRRPDGKTVSFYAFDQDAWTPAYIHEATARGELNAFGNIQWFVDEHADDRESDEMPLPTQLSGWKPLIASEQISYMNFNSFLARHQIISKQFWIFDGDAVTSKPWRLPVQTLPRLAGIVPQVGASTQVYFTEKVQDRPRSQTEGNILHI